WAEERDEAERAVQRRLHVVAQERSQHVDPPQADHDARDRGERLDERSRRRAEHAWRQLREEERYGDREWPGKRERDERRDRGAEQEARGAEHLSPDHGVPGDPRDEAEAERRDRRPGALDQLPRDQADERGRRGRRGGRGALQREIAETE